MDDKTYTRKPPVVHAHQFAAATDKVDDLNAWANALFPGNYPAPGPFMFDGTSMFYSQGPGAWAALPDTWWVVIPQATGALSIMADSDFEAQYQPEG